MFGLALGYEYLNDHHALRHDIALQTAVDTDGVLASLSTLCRFEQQADRDWAVAIHEEMIRVRRRTMLTAIGNEFPPTRTS